MKIVIDSDALIKLAKISILERITNTFHCNIAQQVYDETVTKGVESLHEDAVIISQLVKKGLLRVHEIKIVPHASLGKGEVATKELASKLETNMILSDDQRFIREIADQKPVESAHMIWVLLKNGKITQEQSLAYTKRLRPLIKKRTCDALLELIGGTQP